MNHTETSKFFIKTLFNIYSLCLPQRQRNFDPNQPLHLINHTGLGDSLFTGPALCLLSEHLPFVHHVNPSLNSFVASWKLKQQVFSMKKNSLQSYKIFKNKQVFVLRSNFVSLPLLRSVGANFIATSEELEHATLADLNFQSNTANHYFLEHLLKIKNFLKLDLDSNSYKKYYTRFKDAIPLQEVKLEFVPDIVVHLGGITTKNMQNSEFKNALNILKKNYKILQVGSTDEIDPDLPSIQNLNLNQVAYVLNRCKLFIGNNSGIAQLSRFTSPKTLMFMARTSHLRTGSFYDEDTFKVIAAHNLPCYPCQAFDSACYYHDSNACLRTPTLKKLIELMEKEINISYH